MHRDTLAIEKTDGLAHVRLQGLGEGNHSHGNDVHWGGIIGAGRTQWHVPTRQHKHAPPALRFAGHLIRERPGVDHPGCPEHQRAVTEPHGRPPPARREVRDLIGRLIDGGNGQCDGRERFVEVPPCRRESPECPVEVLWTHPGGRFARHHPRMAGGERAGLVEQHHVYRGKRLDGGELLRQRTTSGHSNGSDRVGDAGQKNEPLRKQRDHCRGRGGDCLTGISVPMPQGQREYRSQGDHERDHGHH